LSKAEQNALQKYIGVENIALECSKCNRVVENLNPDTASVICSYCVQRMVDPPELSLKKVASGKPRGWHLKKKFRDADGTLYSYGELIDESHSSSSGTAKNTGTPSTAPGRRNSSRKKRTG
jgi:hypothetical protein